MQLEASGTLNSSTAAVGANGNVILIPCEGKFGAASFQISGTWSGQIEFETSNDGVNYVSLTATKADGSGSATHATGNGMWFANIASAKYVQARVSAWVSGAASVFMTVSVTPASGTGSGGSGGGAATIADGADVAEGATTDAAVTGDNSGTVSAKLRGLSKMLADVWDSVNHWLKVSIQNSTLAVTQSGTWSVTDTPATVTGSAGAAATVGATSAQALASNSSRKYVDVCNTDDTKTIYLGFGANAAVVGSGVTLAPGAPARLQTTQAINAIASSASANLAIQEWT